MVILKNSIDRNRIIHRYRKAKFEDNKDKSKKKKKKKNYAYRHLTYYLTLYIPSVRVDNLYSISRFSLLRKWDAKDGASYTQFKWIHSAGEIKLKEPDFENKKCRFIRKYDKGGALSLLFLIALKTKYDELRGFRFPGLLFRSEAYRLKEFPVGRGKDADFEHIRSRLRSHYNFCKGEDKRTECWLVEKFLLHPSEWDNILCWGGSGRDNKDEDIFYERVWALNIEPEHIDVVDANGEEIADGQLRQILKSVFPEEALLSSDTIEQYSEMVGRKQKPWFRKEELWKNSDRLSPVLGWKDIDNIIVDKFSSGLKRPETDAQNNYNDSAVNLRNKDLHLRAAQARTWTDILRAYYARGIKRSLPYHFYSFEVGDEVIHTSVLTKNEWIGLNMTLKPEIPNFVRLSGKVPLPDISLPREVVDELVNELAINETWLENRRAFRLVSITGKGKRTVFKFSEMEYLQHKLTAGLLETELRNAIVAHELDAEIVLKNRDTALPLRRILLPDLQSIAELQTRTCTGGVAVVLAIARKSEDDFIIPVYRRTSRVARNPFLLSIAPSGVHQAYIEPDKEANIFCTANREYYEELNEGGETELQSRARLRWDWFYSKCPSLQWLNDHPRSWRMECVTFGLNSFSGGFGFGVLLAIHDPEFWSLYGRNLSGNWEIKEAAELLSSKDVSGITNCLIRPDWADECQMIMAECLVRLSKLYKSKCNIPTITRISPS